MRSMTPRRPIHISSLYLSHLSRGIADWSRVNAIAIKQNLCRPLRSAYIHNCQSLYIEFDKVCMQFRENAATLSLVLTSDSMSN